MTKGPSTWHACWTPQSVQETIFGDVATLRESERAIFLATHTPLPTRKPRGTKKAHKDAGPSILAELEKSLESRQNTLIAVVGPSGSGKTHLVRWVNSHLDARDARFCLVYVPKQANTLRSIVGRILDALPPSAKSDEVRKALEHSFDTARPAQLRAKLFNALDTHLTFTLEEEPSEVTSWSEQELHTRAVILGPRDPVSDERKTGLGALLRTPVIREHLLRDRGHIDTIISSLLDKRHGGDEELPEFDDRTFNLSRNDVRSQLSPGRITSTWEAVFDNPVVVAKLLNEALPGASAEALGLSRGTDINEVFNEARRLLKSQGRQLVLVFEDLAQFGMLDGAILDQFRSQAQDELAPLRAVFAITTGKYDQLGETVRTKVDHEYWMDELDIYDSKDRGLTETLTTKFLNLARLGSKRVLDAYEGASEESRRDGSWVPNKCLDVDGSGEVCPHRTTCWDGFGHVGDIGLFPYNSAGLGKALGGQADRGASATPRTIVERLVQDMLVDAYQEFQTKQFPSQETRSRFAHQSNKSPLAIVRGVEGSPEEVDRVRRVREIWANESKEVPEIREWFDLPEPTEGDDPDPDPDPDPGPAPDPDPPKPETNRPHSAIIEWSSNEKPLPERLGRVLRQQLHADTLDRARLGDFFVDVEKEEGKDFVSAYFNPNCFVLLETDTGLVPSDDFEKFSVVVPKRYQILTGALWFHEGGNWTVGGHDGWAIDARELAEIRMAYEAYTDECAVRIRRRTLKELGEIGRPAAEAVRIRSLAARSIGLLPVDADAAMALRVSLDTSLVLPRDSSFDPSWQKVVHTARLVLEELDDGWVEAFCGVSQGAGGLHAIHSGNLIQAAGDGLTPPDGGTLARPSQSELRRVAEPFLSALEASFEAQRERLSELLATLARLVPATIREDLVNGNADSFRDLIDRVDSVGRMARDKSVFQPPENSGPFLGECEKLRELSPAVIGHWFSVMPDDGGALSNSVVLELQAEWEELDSACKRLQYVFSRLEMTSTAVKQRVNGGADRELIDTVQRELTDTLETVLSVLGRTREGAGDV